MRLFGFQRIALTLVIVGTGTYFAGQALAQSSDEAFAKDAAAGGMAEVKLGQLAEQKGNDPAIREFGKKMEEDHSKAGDRLKDVASKNKVSLPTQMSRADQATYDRLSKLSGPEFDKAYAQDMLKDHQKDVAAFQKESSTGKNPDVKQFASETLPALQDHLKMAQHLNNTEKNTAASR